MQMHQLTDQISVAAQIELADLPAIAAQGFRSIVNNRPDGEEPGQPDNAELEAAAREAGLEWRHIPVISGKINSDQVHGFSEVLWELPGPVLAFCRSGMRSSILWAMQANDTADNILAATTAAGYDLAFLQPWFEMNGRS